MNPLKELQQKEIELQNYMNQRYILETQLNEINSAIDELNNSEESYELISNIMIKKSPEKIKEKLNEKKTLLEYKIKNLKKIESKIMEEMQELRNKVEEEMKKGD